MTRNGTTGAFARLAARARLTFRSLPVRAGGFLLPVLAAIDAPLPAQAQLLAGNGCDWSESALLTAYPETHARYYTATLPTLPPAGSRIRIEGAYLDTRYFSFQLYDGSYRPIDGLPDYLLLPDAGSESTLAGRTASNPAIAPGGRYTAYIDYSPLPSVRSTNTLYTGVDVSSLRTTRVVLRTYLENGAVQLPKIVVETPNGDRRLGTSLSSSECGSSKPAPLELTGPQLNLVSLGLTSLYASRTVQFDVYYGGATGGGDFGLNQDTAFMAATIRNAGDVVVVRGRAPTFRERTGSTPAIPDVRYWSMCQNDKASTLVIACVADRDTRVDADGYYNLVIADAGVVRLPAGSGYTRLPFGATSNGYLIYRQILPGLDFVGSAATVPVGTAPVDVIGDYTPKGIYCSPARFQGRVDAGDSPAAVYAACVLKR